MFNRPKRDLGLAEQSLNHVSTAKTYPEIEQHWENFLLRLEMAWEKTEAVLQQKSQLARFVSNTRVDRKNDDLLNYLNQARNATEHTLALVVESKDGQVVRLDSNEGGEQVKIEKISEDRFLLTPMNEAGAKMKITPNSKLLEVTNRSAKFPVPTKHLGNDVPNDIVIIGRMGLEYYLSLIEDIETFIKDKGIK